MDQATRDALVATDPKSAEVLKPVLRGRDIARYRANWAGRWLIDTHNGYSGLPAVDIDDYPAIKRHLDQFISRLDRRQDKGVTPYNLRNCAYHDEFSSEKVIWIELVDKGRFAYDNSGTFVEATAFMMTGKHMNYLCAVLNAKLVHWYVRKTAPTSGMGVPRWKKVYVEGIPIASSSGPAAEKLRYFLEEARSLLDDDGDTHQIEAEIDSIVYEMYGLSGKEIGVIESSVNS